MGEKADNILGILAIAADTIKTIHATDVKSRSDILARQHADKMQKDAYEYKANITMYNDAKAQARESKKLYDQLALKYQASGLSLDGLNELYKTKVSLDVLDDLTKIDAEDYSKRTEYYLGKAQNYEEKSQVLSKVLFDDVMKAKNIISGGAGPAGGILPSEWDEADIGLGAFEKVYGKDAISPQVLEYYKKNVGLIQKSLDELKLGDTKYNYYEGRSESQDSNDYTKAVKWYNQRIVNSEVLSGKKQVDTQIILGSDDAYAEIPDEENEHIQEAGKGKLEIVDNLSILYGIPPSVSLYEEYEDMFTLARGAKVGSSFTIGDYGTYHESVQRAYNNYKSSNNKDQIAEIARKMFGFRGSFSRFAEAENKLYADTLLQDFRDNGQLDDGEIIENLEDDEFDAIIKGL